MTFQSGVERKFRLLNHRTEERNGTKGTYTAHQFDVEDMETGSKKVIDRNSFDFYKALSKLDSQLEAGDVITVNPIATTVERNGKTYDNFIFEIRKEPISQANF